MPKIIPDLGPRILRTAAHFFETKGFEATEMKALAAELGISVGTLYNYHPGKPELFLAVSLLWKEELTAKMLVRLDDADSPQEKLRAVLLMLYENMESYTGIWQEFVRTGGKLDLRSPLGQKFKQDNELFHSRIQQLFREVWDGHPHAGPLIGDPKNRLSQLMVGSIMHLVMHSTDDPEANRAFVKAWIDFIAPPL